MKRIHVVMVTIGAVAGLLWGFERTRAAQLQTELETRRETDNELARLRREHERLLRLQPSTDELARLSRDVVAEIAPAPSQPLVKAEASVGALKPGAWALAGEWRNCGRATPQAAVETLLWASASGDLEALKGTLEFDDAARAKAVATLARLPVAARAQYGAPEDFLALMVAGNVPLDSALVVARQQFNENDAVEYLRLKRPNGATRQVGLTLRRSADGWKLRVPETAVDKLVQP